MAYPAHPGTSDAPVLFWRDGGVAHIHFNRPAVLNAIDVPMAEAFKAGCEALAQDPEVRCVLMSGEGRGFMAGGDLAAMQEDPAVNPGKLVNGMHGGISVLGKINAPIVAALHGAVAGAGLALAVVADLAIAAEGTRFNLAYPKIGASTDCGASWGLERVVGLRKAMEIALLGEPFDAAQALQMGLLNRVVPADQVQALAEQWAKQIASGPTLALGRIKRLLRDASSNTLDEHLEAEGVNFVDSAKTTDFAEGVGAFLVKRAATFTGR